VQGLVDRRHTAAIKEKIQRHQVIVPALAYISDVAAHVVGRICMQAEHERQRDKGMPQPTKTVKWAG
jgi:hypothetical protein